MPVSGETVDFIAVGRIGKPHGVKGEVRFRMLAEFPGRLRTGNQVYVGEGRQALVVSSLRGTGDKRILGFSGVQDRSEAGLLRNQLVYVHTSDIPELPEGEYYTHDLLGLDVVTESGEALGQISEVIYTGANDVVVVKDSSGSEKLLPVIDEVLLAIDLERAHVLVRLLPGL